MREYDWVRDKARNKIKIICPSCNNKICKNNLATHQQAKKCKSFVKPVENEDK